MPRREIIDVTMVADTLVLASGDVITDTAQAVVVAPSRAGYGSLKSLIVLDEDDQGIALDVVLMRANVSLGAKNAAPNISDADARNVIGIIAVAAADFIDLTGNRIATKSGLDITVQTSSLYLSMISRGAPTYTASGLKVRLGIEHAD